MNLDIKNKLKIIEEFLGLTLFAVFSGLVLGWIGGFFNYSLNYADKLFNTRSFLLYCLPLFGLISTYVYKKLKITKENGCDDLVGRLLSNDHIAFSRGPAVFLGTFLSRLGGAPVGACGPSLEIGASFADSIAKKAPLLSRARKGRPDMFAQIGMSAALAPIFSAPIFAAIFPLEMCRGKITRPKGIFFGLVASLVACRISGTFFSPVETLGLIDFPLSINMLPKLVLLGLASSLTAIFYVSVKKVLSLSASRLDGRPRIKSSVGGALLIALLLAFGVKFYSGSGSFYLKKMLQEPNFNVPADAFLIKLVLMGMVAAFSFKGGEISPLLFSGGALGAFLAPIIGLDPILSSATCAIGLFAAATKCPISAFFLAVELFGLSNPIAYMVIISVAVFFSGESSIYSLQDSSSITPR